jgi:voltage-gated potassium channel
MTPDKPVSGLTRLAEIPTARVYALQRMGGGLLALLILAILGVLGYVALGWNFGDALYMVIITLATVGYEEVQPVETPLERAHTMLLIVLGTFAFYYLVARAVALVAEGEIQRLVGHERVRRQIEELKNHIIVAGYGRMGSLLCAELASAGEPFVLIESSLDRLAEAERQGILHVRGDATDEKVLLEAGLTRARALVTTVPSDADSVFITLTARQLCPKLTIVARAEQPSSQRKLQQAGANHVVLPASIGAHRIASLLTNPSAVEFTELVTKRSSLAIEMDEVAVRDSGPLVGRTLRDADIGRRTGAIVIAVKRADGRVEFPPTGDEPFAPGDSIVVLGRRGTLARFREEFHAS